MNFINTIVKKKKNKNKKISLRMKKNNFLIKFKYQNSIFNINFFFFKELKHPILLSLE